MVRRLIATLVAMTVVAGCSAPSPTPGASDSAAQSPGASSGDAGGIFTDPPAPLDLQPTLDESATASALIGWEGGTVKAIGPGGATYTLEVPPEALAFPTTITMTPLSDLDGFGLDPAPEQMLGVELAPEGLQLVVPARLTMATDAAVPEAGVATGDYLGHGQDAGLVITDFTDAGITFEVSHFSGFWTVWPIKMEDWRAFAMYRQAALERDFENDMAQALGLRRQPELFGIPTQDLWDVVRDLAKRFESDVLNPRRGRAGLGCAEAQLALAAYISYDRTLQLLAVAAADESSPEEVRALYQELKRPIPPSLFDLAWNRCLDEEYQRCAALGEFPRLATFLLAQAAQRDNAAYPLTAEQLGEGQNRLERCGHWRVTLYTWQLDTLPFGTEEQDWTSEIDVRFRAGGPPFGLVGARVDGKGDIQVNKLVWDFGTSGYLGNIQTDEPAEARIEGMTFFNPWELEPVPSELRLWVFAGSISFDNITGNQVTHYDGRYWWGVGTLFGQAYAAVGTIEKGWQFRTHPYRAEFAANGSEQLSNGTRQVQLTVVVAHTPD